MDFYIKAAFRGDSSKILDFVANANAIPTSKFSRYDGFTAYAWKIHAQLYQLAPHLLVSWNFTSRGKPRGFITLSSVVLLLYSLGRNSCWSSNASLIDTLPSKPAVLITISLGRDSPGIALASHRRKLFSCGVGMPLSPYTPAAAAKAGEAFVL